MIWLLPAVYTLLLGFLIWYPYFYQVRTFKQTLKESFSNGGFIVVFVMWTISIFIAIDNHVLLVGYVLFLGCLYLLMYIVDWVINVFRKKNAEG